nr:hypothetical protein [Flavonifractor plautii]
MTGNEAAHGGRGCRHRWHGSCASALRAVLCLSVPV